MSYTFNSKCLDENGGSEVRIIHEWSGTEQLPEIDNLLIEFQTFLVDKKLKAEIGQEKKTILRDCSNNNGEIYYIERLLNMQITDHRKFAISLIFAPYFVKIQNLADTDSFSKIRQWVLRCNELRKVELSIEYLENLIKKSIKRAKKTGIKPLKFEETLRFKNRELYYLLK